MGTSTIGKLTATEMSDVARSRDAMSAVGAGTTTMAKFNYVATFDGTNNDSNNLKLSSSKYQTNVANLRDQARAAASTNQSIGVGYFEGIGTGGDQGGFLQAAFLPTEPIKETANKAYKEFQTQVRDYYNKLENKSDFKPEEITASIACFSRGCSTGIEFAWMINDRGITAADGTVLAAPGSIKVSGGLAMMDPVNRFVDNSRGIPPNVTSPVLVAYATDETRTDFRPMDFSNDPRVTAIWMRGNHSGIGGGYDLNGTAAAVLEGITGYFQNLGTALSSVPEHLNFNSNALATIYTEEFQIARNGQVVEDFETGIKQRAWRVDSGPRKMINMPAPSATNPLTSSYFQDRYEQEDIIQAMYRVANLTEADIREIAAYEGLAPLIAGATLSLNFSSFGSEVNSENDYTLSVPSLANMVRAGMTVQEAVTSTLTNQLGTSLLASGFFGQEAAFDSTSFTNAIDNNNLSGFMDSLSQLEARSCLAQYFIKESLGLDVPIFNSEGVDLTASLNELIPGSTESMTSSVGDILAAFSAELRTSMDADKSGLMLNGSRDPDSPYRPQITAGFMYLPQEFLLGMMDPFETEYFPSADVLALDEQDDYDYPSPWHYRVYIDGVIRDVGTAPAHEPWSHKRYEVGPNEINRLTVFVNGELYIDEYCDLSRYPVSAIGAEAVFSWVWQYSGGNSYWWKFEPPPHYYQPRISSNFGFSLSLDTDNELAAPSPTQFSAALLTQAMSQTGAAGTPPSFNVMRKDEPLLIAAN